MDIEFDGKYKSITNLSWTNIPDFVVITGPNGTGKSQLLELIYSAIAGDNYHRVKITGNNITPDEVIYLRGEWQLNQTTYINLANIQQQLEGHFNSFTSNYNSHVKNRNYWIYQKVLEKANKTHQTLLKEEFFEFFPEVFADNESQLGQKIGEIFYNYRLSEIELQAQNIKPDDIEKIIGKKPWDVLREIIKESRLPFEINDPSSNGFRDTFHLAFTHQTLKEEVFLNNLSSGEKVLVSLVFYLYKSQEKKMFPKLMLLDEPDAHLHPSMAQQFLNVIKNVLVDKYGVQVIMTTHSPSTVVLAPSDSIYEMSATEPRMRKSPSKNYAVSLLTAGLVYVGEGTKYFIVEDKGDVTFYSYVHDKLVSDGLINSDIPLVFIPASTKDQSGGKDMVQNWVGKLQESGLVSIIHGLIDADYGNTPSSGIYIIDRYSIENYIADPILVYAALLDKEKQPEIEGINLAVGEEYKLKSLSIDDLQKIIDKIVSMCAPKGSFANFDETIDNEKVNVVFADGKELFYPKWLMARPGKVIINEIYMKAFSSTIANFENLFKTLKKVNMFPQELVEKLNELKAGV